MTVKTTSEVAAELRLSERKITDLAAKHGIGANAGGRAGYRFSEADVLALWAAMRPKVEVAPRRRRRAP